MSKFLSLSLWGFVTYMCIYYIDFILLYNLQQDLIAYNHLLHGSVNSWEQIGALGLQGIGSNCMYAMGMLVGATSFALFQKWLRGSFRAVSVRVQVQQQEVR